MSAIDAADKLWSEFLATRDQQTRDELVRQYTPLVYFVVGRLGIPPTSLLEADDLIGYGMIGLLTAIDRFDPERGTRFEAFATPRIRGSVIDHIRTLNWLPRTTVSRIRQLETTLATLEQCLGRPAKEEEVANEIGVSVERYRQILLDASTTVLSLDSQLNTLDNGVSPLQDMLEDTDTPSPVEEAERHELAVALATALERLPEREQLLLALYYQEELTMKEISKVLSVSESRVCQLHMQAIMRLRSMLHAPQSDEHQKASYPSAKNDHQVQRTSQQKSKNTLSQPETQGVEALAGGKRKRLVS
jgi:RNA polymerase sigma factor for flagellar operon FliA